jgi:hypothetical protein
MVDWTDWGGHWQVIIGIDTCDTDDPYKRINQYINNLYEEYNIINNQTYSNNKLINAIISRYASTCNLNISWSRCYRAKI